MRYTEILNELKMNPSSLAKFGKQSGSEILGGFEAEMFLLDVQETTTEPDYSYDEKIGWRDDFDDIARFFGFNRNSRNIHLDPVEDDFRDWQQEQINEYVNDRLDDTMHELADAANDGQPEDDHMDPSDFDSDARELLTQQAEGKLHLDLPTWLETMNIKKYSEFAEYFDIEWPHMVDSEPESYNQDVAIDAAVQIQKALGKKIKVNNQYHGDRLQNTYHIEPDSSLTPDEATDMGIELISPPMPLPEMMNDLEKTIKYIDHYAYTNDSTGLHINLSVPNGGEIDYVKLVLFLGDSYVLDQFDRLSNTFARSAFDVIDRARYDYNKGEKALELLQQGLVRAASKALKERNLEKYTSVNMHDNYVEFRSMGGDYVTKWNEIKTGVLRFAQALHVACDPEAEKKAYALKMYKLLSPENYKVNDVVKAFSMVRSGAWSTGSLKRFLKDRADKRKEAKQSDTEDKDQQ
jgi:hypothetical protein